MILLAVSGGPDSMFMLNDQLKKHSSNELVVAFVNYNQRDNSYIDQQIVEKYCGSKKIKLEILELKKEDYKKNNFQDWARVTRYEFFYKIYNQYNCSLLLVAHHKDDFLETALMQEQKNKIVNYYGIKTKTKLWNMNIERPYLFKYFKDELVSKNNQNKLSFATDYTNDLPKYERNIVRINLKKSTKAYKDLLILKFKIKNFFLKFKHKKINKIYLKWEKSNFSQDVFLKLNYHEQLIYKFINENFLNINLSKDKILSIKDFILSNNRTSQYLLKNNVFLYKKHGLLLNKFKKIE